MRSSSPPSVADESSVRRHIIKNSVDPKFRYGVSELKMLHAVRELCGGQVPPARVDDQLPASAPAAAPIPEAAPLADIGMLMVCGIEGRDLWHLPQKNSLVCVHSHCAWWPSFPPPHLNLGSPTFPAAWSRHTQMPQGEQNARRLPFWSRGVYFLKKDHDQLRPAGACCAAAGNALAKRQSKAVEGGPRGR